MPCGFMREGNSFFSKTSQRIRRPPRRSRLLFRPHVLFRKSKPAMQISVCPNKIAGRFRVGRNMLSRRDPLAPKHSLLFKTAQHARHPRRRRQFYFRLHVLFPELKTRNADFCLSKQKCLTCLCRKEPVPRRDALAPKQFLLFKASQRVRCPAAVDCFFVTMCFSAN